VAIIPARGGSRRIPRKNVREFAGRPMIAHAIGCARRSGLFERIIVSTNDEEIGRVARDYGAEVPFERPAALADDYTATNPVIVHAIDWLQQQGVQLTAVCCIYATAPFILPQDLSQGLQMLESGRWSYVFAATAFESSVYRAFHADGEGGLRMLFPEHFNSRSQDLKEVLHDAAQFYWGTPQAWLNNPLVFEHYSTVVRIPSWQVQDIDTEEDWVRAEMLASYLRSVGRFVHADDAIQQ
jgi:N-acylneuraminate cytidylyltransferase